MRMINAPKFPRHQSGFSLIEAMVSLSAGLIVAMATTAFAVALLRNHTETVQSTRVTQDLRVSSEIIGNELRRSGYNQNAIQLVANQDVFSSDFDDLVWGDTHEPTAGACAATIAVGEASSCLLFSYDRLGVNDASDTPNGQEWKGFRRIALDDERGVLQMFLGASTDEPDCGDAVDASGWTTMTPPGIDVTDLSLSNNVSDPIELASIPGASITVRQVGIEISSRVVGTDQERQICDEVRIRADAVDLD